MVQVKTQARDRAPRGSQARRLATLGVAEEKPAYDRRLSDKILAAFNHAYASGAHKVADRLRTVLVDVEDAERENHHRRAASAVSQADLWVAFIRARNGYNALVAQSDAPPAEVQSALDAMKDAYRLWAET